MSPLQRWACKLSAATLGKQSSSISVRSRSLLDAAVKCSPTTVSALEMVISPASALSQPRKPPEDRDAVESVDNLTQLARDMRILLGSGRSDLARDFARSGKSFAAAKS